MPPPDDEERGITQEQRGLPETPLLDISEEQYDKGFADFGRGIDSRLWNPNPGPEQVWVSSLGLAVGDCSKVPYLGIPYDPDADPAVIYQAEGERDFYQLLLAKNGTNIKRQDITPKMADALKWVAGSLDQWEALGLPIDENQQQMRPLWNFIKQL